MNLMEERPKKQNVDEAFIEELSEMLDQPHKDLTWNEKFKTIVREHFDI